MAYVPRNAPQQVKKQTTTYKFGEIRGVDFRGDEPAYFRTPNSKNMYRSRLDIWETHVGFRDIGNLNEEIYGVKKYVFADKYDEIHTHVLIHAGDSMYLWKNYPEPFEVSDLKLLYKGVAKKRIKYAVYKNILLMLDGHYLYLYDGEVFDLAENRAFAPTTYISKDMHFDTGTDYSTKHYTIASQTNHQQRNFLTGRFTESFHQNPELDYAVSYTIGGTGITNIAMTKATFLSKVQYKDDTYTFVYSGGWKLNGVAVTLSQYGITTYGTAATNDRIDVTVAGADNIPTKVFRLSMRDLDKDFVQVKWESGGVEHICTKTDTPSTNEQFSFDSINGLIIFGSAPPSPDTVGVDNIFVTASKTSLGYADKINHCTEMLVFDDRVFLTGNPSYPNYVFWSGSGDYTYFGELMFSDKAGTGYSPVVALQLLPNASFLSIKQDTSQDGTYAVWSKIDTNDDVLGTIYTPSTGNSTLGCLGNFSHKVFIDDNVFLSSKGLSAISRNLSISYERNVEHRSTLVDPKFLEEDLSSAIIEQHANRLYILFPNGHCYIADGNMRTTGSMAVSEHSEYEWAYLEDIGFYEGQHLEDETYVGGTFKSPTCLCSLGDDELYFGAGGHLMKFWFDADKSNGVYTPKAFNFNGRAINEYVDTAYTWFNSQNRFKKLIRKYNDLYCEARTRTYVQVMYRTEKTFLADSRVLEYNSSVFDFADVDFDDFSFETLNKVSFVLRKVKGKRFRRLQIRIKSRGVDSPIAFKSLILDAQILTRRLK